MADKAKGIRNLESTGSAFNAISFLIETKIKGLINTALPVIVTKVNTDEGYVDVQPLVAQTDSYGNILETPTIVKLPYMRIQGGLAALKVDPVAGDIGLVIFAQQDCSNISKEQPSPVQPGSFRSFSMADGFYIGGFLNQTPKIWLELTQDNVATVHAPEKIILETKSAEISADSIKIKGNTEITGKLTVSDEITSDGNITSKGDVKAGIISLTTHIHGGVMSGGGTTGPAQ